MRISDWSSDVCSSDLSPAWIVRKAADLQAIYSDTVNFSNKDFAPFAQLVGESWSSLPAETDPPMHGLYRKWINPVFTPKAMRELEEKITNYARDRKSTRLNYSH